MNFETLKLGFKNYLEELKETSNKDYNVESSEASIFMYANEFKNYITDELNCDTSIFSKSINDILKMDIVNGKLVDPNEENSGDSFNISDNENVPEESVDGEIAADASIENAPVVDTEGADNAVAPEEGNNENILTSILNNLFEDESVKGLLDTDKSGDLNDEEIQTFLDAIKGIDGNEEDISLEDILGALQAIQDESFSLEPEVEEPEVEEVDDVQQPQSAQQPSNVSSGGNAGRTSGGNVAPLQSSQPQEKTLVDMTKEELNSELNKAQSDLSTKQDTLSSLLDGSDSKIQDLQGNIDEAYEAYQEQLKLVDEDLAKEVDELKTSIDDKQAEIDAKELEISNQETVVSNAENSYNNAVSTRETLESSLSSLKSADRSNMDSDKQAELDSKIADLEQKIETAKKAETEAKEAWDDAKDKLKQLEDDKTELETGEGGLEELESQMTELEERIAEEHPQIKQYMDDYNDAKEDLATYKDSAISTAKADVVQAQDYVNEINTAINEVENKEKAAEYSLNPKDQYNSEEGQRLVDTAMDMLAKYGSSTGYCATGVSRTMAMAYGISMGGNGCDWDSNMDQLVSKGMFVEVTSEYPSSGDLTSLPAGAVVCWEATTGTGGGGYEYGHVTIADGNGGEISDHHASNIYQTIGGRSDTYRVYIPV